MLKIMIDWLYKNCRCKKKKYMPLKEATESGTSFLINKNEINNENINELLSLAVKNKNNEMVSFLLSKKPTNLDENVKVACSNSNYFIVELLLQHGANPLVGYKHTSSMNIYKLLHRYEQKAELIT
jgi:hypothetical protein